jgi:hypothetical protein
MDRFHACFAASCLVAIFLWSTHAAADIYRWDDENGARQATNHLEDVPKKYREAAIADLERRKATNNRINIIEPDAKGTASTPRNAGAPAAAPASPQRPSANPMPGGQSEMWWRQTALQLERNVNAAKSALSKAQSSHKEDAGVTIVGRGRGGRGPGAGGPGRPGARARLGNNDSSSDYTEYSHERDLDELEVAVEDAERAYNDFHDQARRADVPNGWLRR